TRRIGCLERRGLPGVPVGRREQYEVSAEQIKGRQSCSVASQEHMRCARSGTALGFTWVLVEQTLVARLEHHRRGVVAVADLDRAVVDQLLHFVGPQGARDPRYVSGIGHYSSFRGWGD